MAIKARTDHQPNRTKTTEAEMGYRSVLVHADSSRSAEGRISAAVRIAKACNAELTGVFLKSELAPGYMVTEGVVSSVASFEAFYEERDRRTAEASTAAHLAFDRLAQNASVQTSWHDLNGDTDEDFIGFARRHDLTVLPRRMKALSGSHTISAESIGMACGGPILIMPEGGISEAFGRKILVAWKDSRESARVLRDAWPFLREADEIHFVTAARDGQRYLDDLLQAHLKAHGCKVARLTLDRDTDLSTGEIIRNQVALLGADMVVMGLFGHSRLQEFVLGGASRSLLDHASAPLLVSH